MLQINSLARKPVGLQAATETDMMYHSCLFAPKLKTSVQQDGFGQILYLEYPFCLKTFSVSISACLG